MKTAGYNSRISWISMAAIAVIGFLVSLPMRLLGLFFVIILDTYDVDREQALIPIVTYGTIRTLSGPLVGYLSEVFGLQVIILIGCILSCVGLGLSYFVKDIVMLTVTLGFVYGTGFSFANNLTTSVIRQHFTKYISLTTGILITSSSLGSTVMTPVIHYLKNLYGTSGMFLVLSGIFLHTIPAAIFLKNPKNEEYESQKNLFKKHFINNITNLKQVDYENSNSVSKEEKINEIMLFKPVIPSKKFNTVNREKEINLSDKDKKSYINEAFERKSEGQDLNETYVLKKSNETSFTFASGNQQKINVDRSNIELLKYSKIDTENILNSLTLVKYYTPTNASESVGKNCQKQDPESLLKMKKSNKLCDSIRLFYNPTFLLQMIIQSGHAFGYTLVLSILIDYARDKQISTKDALYFITCMPITQIFGSLGLNWITDGAYMTRVNFCTICFSLLALDLGFLIWCNNFNLLMAGYLVYGFVNGALLSIFPGMIMDNIEKENQNMALASRFTLYGILCPLKAPIVGYFRGHLGSYEGVYYIIVALSIFCGILSKLTPILVSCRQKT